jgi:hypothetical protein
MPGLNGYIHLGEDLAHRVWNKSLGFSYDDKINKRYHWLCHVMPDLAL